MKFKLMFSALDIQIKEYDSLDDAVRFCMVKCKRFGTDSFVLSYSCENDKKKKWEFMCDLKHMRYCCVVRYAGAPLPLRFVMDKIDMDLSFLDDVKPLADTAASFDDDLPF